MLTDEQARAIIGNLEKLLRERNVERLTKMVNYCGLILEPYAVGLPNRELTDGDLLKIRQLSEFLPGRNRQISDALFI